MKTKSRQEDGIAECIEAHIAHQIKCNKQNKKTRMQGQTGWPSFSLL